MHYLSSFPDDAAVAEAMLHWEEDESEDEGEEEDHTTAAAESASQPSLNVFAAEFQPGRPVILAPLPPSAAAAKEFVPGASPLVRSAAGASTGSLAGPAAAASTPAQEAAVVSPQQQQPGAVAPGGGGSWAAKLFRPPPDDSSKAPPEPPPPNAGRGGSASAALTSKPPPPAAAAAPRDAAFGRDQPLSIGSQWDHAQVVFCTADTLRAYHDTARGGSNFMIEARGDSGSAPVVLLVSYQKKSSRSGQPLTQRHGSSEASMRLPMRRGASISWLPLHADAVPPRRRGCDVQRLRPDGPPTARQRRPDPARHLRRRSLRRGWRAGLRSGASEERSNRATTALTPRACRLR